MPYTPAGVTVDPNGQTVVVNLKTPSGSAAVAYTTQHGSTLHSFPVTINSRTGFFVVDKETYTLSATVSGAENANGAGGTRSIDLSGGGVLGVQISAANANLAGAYASRGPAWQANHDYLAGELVTNGGTLYSANSTFTSGASFNVANWTSLGGISGGSAQSITALWKFTALPEIHASSGDATPVFGRSVADGITVGKWNIVHDGPAGDLLHLTTGANTGPSRTVADGVLNGTTTITSATAAFTTGAVAVGVGTDVGKTVTGTGIPAGTTIASVTNATTAVLSQAATATASGVSLTLGSGPNSNGAVIAIGVDNGGTGLVVQNKSTGQGVTINQLNSAQSGAYGLGVFGNSPNSPAAYFQVGPLASTMPVTRFGPASAGAAPAGSLHVHFVDNGIGGATTAGQIGADVGTLDWKRTIQTVAPNASVTPLLRVADEVASNPSEAYLGGKTNGELGLSVYRWSGSAALMYAFKWQATSDRFRLLATQGAIAKGSETMSTMIEVRATAGVGSKGQLGFFGNCTNQQTSTPAAATDLASALTLVNALRTGLLANGLFA